MADKAPNLYDAYIIDGIPQALTPAGLLQECTLPGAHPSVQPAGNGAGSAPGSVHSCSSPAGVKACGIPSMM